MQLLTHTEARQIAESMWGRGGTNSEKTNTRGAFWFSCSGHGGFVIDARVLDAETLEKVTQHASLEQVTRYHLNGKTYGLMWPGRQNRFRVPHNVERETFEILVLEEDCDWSLAYIYTTIRLKRDLGDAEREVDMAVQAARTFWEWLDPANPKIQALKARDAARAAGDPNLIVSARRVDDRVTRVWTADAVEHLVEGYSDARDEFGTPWLNLCQVVG